MPDLPPALRSNSVDFGAAAARALLSLVPAGGFVSELLTAVLPNQRQDRIARYIFAVERELQNLAARFEAADAHQKTEQQTHLFELGARSSITAASMRRVDDIARAVAIGLSGDDLAAMRAGRFVELLSDLSDDDIVLLCSFSKPYSEDKSWLEAHEDTLFSLEYYRVLREKRTPQEEIRRLGAAFDLQFLRLIAKGLVEQRDKFMLPRQMAENIEDLARSGGGSGTSFPRQADRELERDLDDPKITPLGEFVLEQLGLLPGRDPVASSGKEWDAINEAQES